MAGPAAAPRPELRRVARGGALNLVGFVVSGILGFVLTLVLTRTLGDSGAGVFFGAVAVFTILANVTELGADTGVVRFVARFRELGRHVDLRRTIGVALIPAAVAGLAAGVLLMLGAATIAQTFGKDRPDDIARFLRLLAPFLPMATIATVALAASRGFGSMKPFVAIEAVGKPALKPTLILVLAAGGLSTAEVALGWGIPEAIACGAALVVLVRWLRTADAAVIPGEPRRGPAELAREFWAFSAPRGVAAAFQISVVWFDVLLLGRYRPSAEVGVYAAASRIVTVGTFALQSIRLAIAPQISGLLARGDRGGAQAVYQTATWWLIAASWPLFLVLVVFAPVVLSTFGPGFATGQTALVVLSLAMLVNLGTGNVTVVLLMGGRSSWNLVNTAVALGLNIGLNLLLIPRYGMEGAAIAWSISILADNLLALAEVWAFLRMQPFGRGYLPAVGLAAACWGGLGVLARAIMGPTVAGLVLLVAVGLPLYLWALFRLRTVLRLDELFASLRGAGAPAGGGASPMERTGSAAVTPTSIDPSGRSAAAATSRRVAKAGFRGWGMLTADLRPPPDVLLIGTKRGGTTSMARYLFAHPQVVPLFPRMAAPKGVRYLDEHFDRSDRWYRSHLGTVLTRGSVHHPRRLALDATANYLFHPLGAERAQRTAPDAKILVLVRDPVERAWSHWRERTRLGLETLSFEDALAAEAERLEGARNRWGPDPGDLLDVGANHAYRAQGVYFDLLAPWLDRYGERVLVLVSEEMYADSAVAYARVLQHLDLPPFDIGTYYAANFRAPTSSMLPATREELEAFFAPHTRRLEALLGKELPWGYRGRG